MPSQECNSNESICARIISLSPGHNCVCCCLDNRTKVLLPGSFASHIAIGDGISFAIPHESATGAEAFITRHSGETGTCLYLAPIEHATAPRLDKRGQNFVSAPVRNSRLGISTVFLPCAALGKYFFGIDGRSASPTLYEVLRILRNSSLAEIRVAFKLRSLELTSIGAPRGAHIALERAFNILGHPELRAHYDGLLSSEDIPPIFPYGGFGLLLVTGERPKNGDMFFAKRVLGFLPQQARRQFHVLLRSCEFYWDRAFCRDSRQKVQFWLDSALVPIAWDPSWNRWKHNLATKIEVAGTFVRSAKRKEHNGACKDVEFDTGLPSRIAITLPENWRCDIEKARDLYRRFGLYSRQLDQIRLCLEHKAVERRDLERMCSELGIPGDFDVSQISWRPDYDQFFYCQLSRLAHRIYLFRGEYIIDLQKAVVVETPQLGHATYIFAKPRSMESFLALYTKISKEHIRHNRDNVGERLGFLGRVIHGTNRRAWLNEMCQRFGEKIKPG